jgi:hypothetical protein
VRGPWGPKAIQYAAREKNDVLEAVLIFVQRRVPSRYWTQLIRDVKVASSLSIGHVGVCIKVYQRHTGLLLLQGHLGPVDLHAISQSHPQISLLLRGHGLPSLLNTGERRVGDGVGTTDLSRAHRRAQGSGGSAGGAEHGTAHFCGFVLQVRKKGAAAAASWKRERENWIVYRAARQGR